MLHLWGAATAHPQSKIARLELKTGDLNVYGEGESDWLAAQLDKILSALLELARKR